MTPIVYKTAMWNIRLDFFCPTCCDNVNLLDDVSNYRFAPGHRLFNAPCLDANVRCPICEECFTVDIVKPRG